MNPMLMTLLLFYQESGAHAPTSNAASPPDSTAVKADLLAKPNVQRPAAQQAAALTKDTATGAKRGKHRRSAKSKTSAPAAITPDSVNQSTSFAQAAPVEGFLDKAATTAALQLQPSSKQQQQAAAPANMASGHSKAGVTSADQKATLKEAIQEAPAPVESSVQPEYVSPKLRKARAAAAQADAAASPPPEAAGHKADSPSSRIAASAMQINPASPPLPQSHLDGSTDFARDAGIHQQDGPLPLSVQVKASLDLADADGSMPPSRASDAVLATGQALPSQQTSVRMAKETGAGPTQPLEPAAESICDVQADDRAPQQAAEHRPDATQREVQLPSPAIAAARAANVPVASGGFGSLISIEDPRAARRNELHKHVSDARCSPGASVLDKAPATLGAMPLSAQAPSTAQQASVTSLQSLEPAIVPASVKIAAPSQTEELLQISGQAAGSVGKAGSAVVAANSSPLALARATESEAQDVTAGIDFHAGDGALPPHIFKKPSRADALSPPKKPAAPVVNQWKPKPAHVASQPAQAVVRQQTSDVSANPVLQDGFAGNKPNFNAAAAPEEMRAPIISAAEDRMLQRKPEDHALPSGNQHSPMHKGGTGLARDRKRQLSDRSDIPHGGGEPGRIRPDQGKMAISAKPVALEATAAKRRRLGSEDAVVQGTSPATVAADKLPASGLHTGSESATASRTSSPDGLPSHPSSSGPQQPADEHGRALLDRAQPSGILPAENMSSMDATVSQDSPPALSSAPQRSAKFHKQVDGAALAGPKGLHKASAQSAKSLQLSKAQESDSPRKSAGLSSAAQAAKVSAELPGKQVLGAGGQFSASSDRLVAQTGGRRGSTDGARPGAPKSRLSNGGSGSGNAAKSDISKLAKPKQGEDGSQTAAQHI